MPAALLVASTRSHTDARETLRIQDVGAVLTEAGWSVDLLVPRCSALLTATMPPKVRVMHVPGMPFCDTPPRRPSLRRMGIASLMLLRGAACVSRNKYSIVHSFNDGAVVTRYICCATLYKLPYVADFTDPFGVRGLYRGIRARIARRLENAAMRHAAAVVFADAGASTLMEMRPPTARVSIIPDPHAEISPDSFTRAEFADALAKIYSYSMRQH